MEKNCPGCGKSLEAVGEVQFCPFCGVSVERETGSEESERYSTWDDRANVGFFRALFDTWTKSVFHPTDFFSAMPVKGGYGGPLLYGFIVGEIAVLFSLFWQGILMMMGVFGESSEQMEAMGVSVAVLVIVAFLSPLLVLIGYFLSSGILHVCLILVGGARRDFEATFRVVCYAAGANLFNIVPFFGGLVAWVWNAALNIIGIRETHGISTGRALLAYILPALVCCAFLALTLLLTVPKISDWFEYW